MSISRFALALACLVAPIVAQPTLTVQTSGTVPRIPGTPAIPRCPTTPQPYYFSITGTISQAPPITQEIRLLVRPYLYDNSTIPGCQWVSQCQRAFVLPDNSFVVIGQFGTDNVPRTWFSGQRADVMFALIDRSANVPACISDPASVSVAVSNVNQINIDPTIPTFHDFDAPCTSTVMNAIGNPQPAQGIQFILPSSGAVAFGLALPGGFPFQNCTVFLNPTIPLILVPTDAGGSLAFSLPNDPTLIGADIGSQGIQVAGGALDLTQPTVVSIR